MKRTLATLTLLTAAVWAGCVQPPAADDRYQSQLRLVDEMIGRLEVSASTDRDRQMLDQLRRLKGEIEKMRETHRRDRQRIEHLEQEVSRLRVAEVYELDHIEILFHTRATPKGVTLWVAPADNQNDASKVAGSFVVTLHRPGLWGMGTPGKALCEWRLSAEDVKDRWEGSVYRGYHLELPWPEGKPPDVGHAVLSVTFTTARDQAFTATKDLRIGGE